MQLGISSRGVGFNFMLISKDTVTNTVENYFAKSPPDFRFFKIICDNKIKCIVALDEIMFRPGWDAVTDIKVILDIARIHTYQGENIPKNALVIETNRAGFERHYKKIKKNAK